MGHPGTGTAAPAASWPGLLGTLLRGQELTSGDTAWAMREIMSGAATAAQMAGFAVALRGKGETPAEIAGMVEVMLAEAAVLELPEPVRRAAVDVVGTGGDRAHTVNISTMAALVVAGTGVPVVKHGNRAASSACGAADLLERLGVPLGLAPAAVARCVQEAGIGFCFAAAFHPGMRHTSVVRRELGVPTTFNFLGPLTNPGHPPAAAVGCADLVMAPVMARVFAARGDRVLLLRGEDGLDEFTTAAPTRIWAVRDGGVTEHVLDARDLGLARSAPGALRGGDAGYNAGVARDLLAGATGPVRDAVLVNAAAALVAQDGTGGGTTAELATALRGGLDRATQSLDSGAAAAVLDRWLALAARLHPAG